MPYQRLRIRGTEYFRDHTHWKNHILDKYKSSILEEEIIHLRWWTNGKISATSTSKPNNGTEGFNWLIMLVAMIGTLPLNRNMILWSQNYHFINVQVYCHLIHHDYALQRLVYHLHVWACTQMEFPQWIGLCGTGVRRLPPGWQVWGSILGQVTPKALKQVI